MWLQWSGTVAFYREREEKSVRLPRSLWYLPAVPACPLHWGPLVARQGVAVGGGVGYGRPRLTAVLAVSPACSRVVEFPPPHLDRAAAPSSGGTGQNTRDPSALSVPEYES
ncbi:hypothetical protein SKAU_G00409390 [Synaphobranchus kaupii]|uniref:Uncharacterized protein n=1 Tax=Synaphobranchus kaupii TaxID=118154 RepID=A0A9Q1EAP6_SYNKA|nr:hypothetical protein SKAU_G00409390 [Synaphobranchus kaupii]